MKNKIVNILGALFCLLIIAYYAHGFYQDWKVRHMPTEAYSAEIGKYIVSFSKPEEFEVNKSLDGNGLRISHEGGTSIGCFDNYVSLITISLVSKEGSEDKSQNISYSEVDDSTVLEVVNNLSHVCWKDNESRYSKQVSEIIGSIKVE